MRVNFKLNKTPVQIEAVANEKLVHVLRREFGLMSLKSSCHKGQCGACTVLMNEKPVSSCIIPVFKAEDADIVTLEYFKTTQEYKTIIAGFDLAGVKTCGFCDAGKIFFTYAVMKSDLNISDPACKEKIRMFYSGIMCRCTSFDDLFSAVKKIGKLPRKK